MAITFYYGSGSPFAWKVWLALEHKQLPYAFERVMFDSGELKSERYLAINPRGKIPALVDGDLALYESNAIVEYLEDRYPERTILGDAPAERARNRCMAAEADNYLYPLQRELFTQTLFRPADKGRDLEAIGRVHSAILGELERWERALSGAPFFGGAGPRLSDFAAYPVLRGLTRVDQREPEHGLGERLPPWLHGYFARLEALPYASKTWPPHWKG